MADYYHRNFDFDSGSLGRNLATLDHKINRDIDRIQEQVVDIGEVNLRVNAPWKDDTGNARRGLWAVGNKLPNGTRRISMGHAVEYGVYLEESNGGRFAVVMDTMLKTGQQFMRSLEHLFAQLDNPAPVIAPSGSGGSSRGTYAVREKSGRFADQGKGRSKAAIAARAAEAKRKARNTAARARYAAKKLSGTLPTKRTKRG